MKKNIFPCCILVRGNKKRVAAQVLWLQRMRVVSFIFEALPGKIEALVGQKTQRELQTRKEEEVAEIHQAQRSKLLHSCTRHFHLSFIRVHWRFTRLKRPLYPQRKPSMFAVPTFFWRRVSCPDDSWEMEQRQRVQKVTGVPEPRGWGLGWHKKKNRYRSENNVFWKNKLVFNFNTEGKQWLSCINGPWLTAPSLFCLLCALI